jgi:hypothetical protein
MVSITETPYLDYPESKLLVGCRDVELMKELSSMAPIK